MTQKIVSLFDIHLPYHINLKPIWKFIHDFKPDVVVLGGDLHDWEAVSDWIANQSLRLDGQSIKRCYKEIHDIILNPLLMAMPAHCQVKYLKGNHEFWVDQAINLNRNGQGYWELENNIDLKKYHMEVFPINGVYQPCENLLYIHGVFTNEFHAKKTVQAYHNSVIYVHAHTTQTYTDISPVNVTKFYTAQCAGCLCTLNPHFMKNRPNKWVNGLNFAYIDEKTASFGSTQVVIVHGGFWALGHYYA